VERVARTKIMINARKFLERKAKSRGSLGQFSHRCENIVMDLNPVLYEAAYCVLLT
jgi:hypothetical protein